MSTESFNFNAFIQESKDCLLKPKEYFATMKTTGGLSEPVIKALIYGVVSGALSFLWSVLNLSAVGGGMFGGAVGIMVFIWAIIGAVVGLFIGAVIMLIISAICKGNTDFEANARVVAAFMVLMPIRSALGFMYSINFTLAMVVGALVSLYGIYMMYHALVQTLKANEGTSKVVSYILVGLMVLFIISGLFAKRAAKGFLNNLEDKGTIDEYSNKYLKEMEKAAKAFEEAAEEAKDEFDEDMEGEAEAAAEDTTTE